MGKLLHVCMPSHSMNQIVTHSTAKMTLLQEHVCSGAAGESLNVWGCSDTTLTYIFTFSSPAYNDACYAMSAPFLSPMINS